MASCVTTSEGDAGQTLNSRPIHGPVLLPPCRICRRKASGCHYGVNTFEACKVCPWIKNVVVTHYSHGFVDFIRMQFLCVNKCSGACDYTYPGNVVS